MNERGQYGRQASSCYAQGRLRGQYGASVGATVQAALSGEDVKKINEGLQSAAAEMILAMGGVPSAHSFDFVALSKDPAGWVARGQASEERMRQSPLYPLWQSLVSPTLHDFRSEAVTGVLHDVAHWEDRMLAMRAAIDAEMKKHGAAGLRSVAPAPVSTSLTEDVEAAARAAGRGLKRFGEGALDVGGDVWKFAKYGAWAVLGIGAVVALSSVAHDLRTGKDPAEKYVGLVRSRSRTAARAALPPPAQLALAEGLV